MTPRYAAADQALQRFVAENTPFLRDQLGPDTAGFTAHELFVVCRYLFRLDADKAVQRGQSITPATLSSALFLGQACFTRETFLKAISWDHRGDILSRPLHAIQQETSNHSPRVAAYLQQIDTERYRMAFRAIGDIGQTIRHEIDTLGELVLSISQQPTPTVELQVVKQFRKLHGLVQAMGYQGRAGAALSLAAGFAPPNVERAVGRIYLNRLDRLANRMARYQFQLRGHGMHQNLTKRIWAQYDKLRAELGDAVRLSTPSQRVALTTDGPSC